MSLNKQPYFVVALVIVLALAIWRATIADAITGDVAMYLQCGDLLLRGQTIYVDFIDLNPPLVFFVSMLPAVFSRLTAVPLLIAGSIACSVWALLSLFAVNYVLSRCRPLLSDASSGAVLLACATLSAFTTYDFGQREHLLALAWLPYLYMRWGRVNAIVFPRLIIFILAFCAGLLICFKPYFLLLPLFLEVILWFKRDSDRQYLWRGELLGLVCAGASYALALMLMPGQSKTYLFGYLAPLLSAGYSAFDKNEPLVMLSSIWYPCLALVLCSVVAFALSLIKKLSSAPQNALLWVLFGQIVCSFALIQIQHKGWCYHGIPMMVMALQMLALSLSLLTQNFGQRWRYFLAVLLTVISVGASSWWITGVHSRLHTEWEQILPALAAPDTRVALLDTTDTPWFVRATAARIWPGSRYLWLFPVPIYQSLLKSGRVDQARVDSEMTKLVDFLAADLERDKAPLVVLRTTGCFALPEAFDMQKYLTGYGLAAALKHYRLVQQTEHYRFFRRLPD